MHQEPFSALCDRHNRVVGLLWLQLSLCSCVQVRSAPRCGTSCSSGRTPTWTLWCWSGRGWEWTRDLRRWSKGSVRMLLLFHTTQSFFCLCGWCDDSGSGLSMQIPVIRRTRPQASGGRWRQTPGHPAAQHDCIHADDESTDASSLLIGAKWYILSLQTWTFVPCECFCFSWTKMTSGRKWGVWWGSPTLASHTAKRSMRYWTNWPTWWVSVLLWTLGVHLTDIHPL